MQRSLAREARARVGGGVIVVLDEVYFPNISGSLVGQSPASVSSNPVLANTLAIPALDRAKSLAWVLHAGRRPCAGYPLRAGESAARA